MTNSVYAAAMAAQEHQQAADELVLRDLPGKLALLVFAAATLALGWELWGVLFRFGSPFIPLPALRADDIAGVAIFTIGWLALLIGLTVMRRRRKVPAS